jgi:hypothetical protein
MGQITSLRIEDLKTIIAQLCIKGNDSTLKL